jgi:hypothetical protein
MIDTVLMLESSEYVSSKKIPPAVARHRFPTEQVLIFLANH